MGLFNVLEEKYDSLIDKLELDGARRPKLVLPSLALILIGFIAILIVLLLPVSYDLNVKVSLNSEPVPNTLLVLTSGNSELANFKLDQSGLISFTQGLAALISSNDSSVVFEGKILRLPFTIFAKYNQYNKTVNVQSVFDQNVLLIEFNSDAGKNHFKNNTNETLYCSDGTASGNCVNTQGDYCDPQSLTIIKSNYCYACSDGTIKGECSVSKTGYYCNDESNLVEDLTKCSDSKCYNGNEELKTGECSKTDVGYSCDGLTQTLVKNNNCIDITVCSPRDLACKCKKDPRLCTSANLSTSSMLVSVYDNSSDLLSGMNVSVKLFKQNPITLSLDELPETLQYTSSGLAVFQGLTVGESYKAVATALDCGISGGSNLVQIDVQQLKTTISLKLIKTLNGCTASYETSNTTIQIGTTNNSVFTIFPISKIAFYDLYPENYLTNYPEEVLSGVQKGSPVTEVNRMDASLTYYGIAWTPGYLYSDLQKVQVQGNTIFSLDAQKNSNKSWDPQRTLDANSGNLTVLVLDEADNPLSDVVLNVYDTSFTSISEPISINKYLYYVSPQSTIGSIRTGYDGVSRMSPLKKGVTYLVTAVSGAASGSGTVKISDKVNPLTIRLSLHYANVSLKVYDPYDDLPVNSTVKLTYYGDLTTWSCDISPSSPNCVIKNVYAGIPIYVNVTPNDKNYSVGTDAVESFIVANETFNKREYQLTRPRDEPYLTNPQFFDAATSLGPLSSITANSKLKVTATLQLPKNKTDWTGIMVKLQDDSKISNPVDATAFGFTSVNENSVGASFCRPTDSSFFSLMNSPNTAKLDSSYDQFQLLYWNSSNYPGKQIPITFYVQTSLKDNVNSYSLSYSAFSQAGAFTLRNPSDTALQRNFSGDGLNFCQANKTQSMSLLVRNSENTICSDSYCFTLTGVSVNGKQLQKNDFIPNTPSTVVLNGYLQFEQTVLPSEFNSITVSGGNSLLPLTSLIDFQLPTPETIAPNVNKRTSYSFTPNLDVNKVPVIPASPTLLHPVTIYYNVTGISGPSVLSVIFPKVRGSQATVNFPLSVTEPSTGSGTGADQYLISKEVGECNQTVTISRKGDQLLPDCTKIVLRVTSIFPADGVLFNYSGFAPNAVKIEDINSTSDVSSSSSLYSSCFSSGSEIADPVEPKFRFSSFGVSGTDCPYSKFGPVGNAFNTDNGVLFEGKIRFLVDNVNVTLNFTVKVSELEQNFNNSLNFPPAYYAFKTKIWNPTVDPGAVAAGFDNVSLVGIYYNNQLRSGFSDSDKPIFRVGVTNPGTDLSKLSRSSPYYFYVNEKDPTYQAGKSIGFLTNTQATQQGAASFSEKQSYPVIPLESILSNSTPNDPLNAANKASQICKVINAFDLLVNTTAFYRYYDNSAMYCANNKDGNYECRPSVEAWKSVTSQPNPQTFTCTGQKPTGDMSTTSNAYYTACNEHFDVTGSTCDHTTSLNCVDPLVYSTYKVYSYDSQCIAQDYANKLGLRSVSAGQVIKIFEPYSTSFAYAYGANDKGECDIANAITKVNQLEGSNYVQTSSSSKFTTQSSENVLSLQSGGSSLNVYCVKDKARCGNPTPFQSGTRTPVSGSEQDVLTYACNWNCSMNTGSFSIIGQKIVEDWDNSTPLKSTSLFQSPDITTKFKKLPYDLFSNVMLDKTFEFNFPVNLMYDYDAVFNDINNLINSNACGGFNSNFALTRDSNAPAHLALTSDNGIYNFKVKISLEGQLRNPLEVTYSPISVDNSNNAGGLGFNCKAPYVQSSQPYLYGKVYAFGDGCIVGNNNALVDSITDPKYWKLFLHGGESKALFWHCSNEAISYPGKTDAITGCVSLTFGYFTVDQKTGLLFYPDQKDLINAILNENNNDYTIGIHSIDKNLQEGLTSVNADDHSTSTNLGRGLTTIKDSLRIQILTDESNTGLIKNGAGKYNGAILQDG